MHLSSDKFYLLHYLENKDTELTSFADLDIIQTNHIDSVVDVLEPDLRHPDRPTPNVNADVVQNSFVYEEHYGK